ncbi:mandelate racemase [Sporanaerobium hydrogeniformans]|uniref:Mandelate racemase n=1 Tax=Sporanaerobium hydrogeniformans TaxID=3072179 RepID=A0AC61DAL2_9FIRM|nr:mandelate racemase/muconate lactonizing enzyme family protein [Sporanaerobium hydrogeniformans]PHV70083.1 mandelate racemase [Sporanaerobium hydrogeniformans]
MNYKIKNVNFYRATSKISKPIADSTHSISKIAFYIVQMQLENGVIGQGYLLSFHYSPNAIEGALKDACQFINERNYEVFETVKVKQDWDMEAEYFGNTGINTCAIAAINIAMWDAWGKSLNTPIWKMLGSSSKKIPVYGSGGWISYTDEELLEEVLDYKRRGFTAVKIKVGSGSIEKDLQRLSKCREALGDSVKIMMDANQGMDVPTALKLAEQAVKIGIHWFEEPITHTDFAGYELLRNKCGISLAMGEREYDCEALKALISKNALDLWQPDIVRLGGVEEWRKSAALASAYHLPVLPHYYKDYDVPLLCTVPMAYGAESFDWIDGIIDNAMRIENGFAYPREGAGWGFNFKEEFLEEVK